LHQSLGAVARRLRSPELLGEYLALVVELMQRTSISIHGRHATEPSPGLPTFLQQAPVLVGQVPLDGLRTGCNGRHAPARQPPAAADRLLQPGHARQPRLLQRQRHGTLLVDVERRLELTLRGLWGEPCRSCPTRCGRRRGGCGHRHHALPAADGLRLPEVLDDRPGATAVQRYRAMLAHLAGHRRWSRPQVADNLSPLQRLAVECFEDARIDHLVLRRFPRPGAGAAGLAPGARRGRLRPGARDPACATAWPACRARCSTRSTPTATPRCASLSRAFTSSCRAAIRPPPPWPAWRWSGPRARAARATSWRWCALPTRMVDWRDDNRHLWTFIEAGDEEDTAPDPTHQPAPDEGGLPPRHYPEWDAATRAHRPDWVSVYDTLQPAGQPPTSTRCWRATPPRRATSSGCWTCSSRRTARGCATRSRAANWTWTWRCARWPTGAPVPSPTRAST
jgi:nitric oxide reductase NorD protein